MFGFRLFVVSLVWLGKVLVVVYKVVDYGFPSDRLDDVLYGAV